MLVCRPNAFESDPNINNPFSCVDGLEVVLMIIQQGHQHDGWAMWVRVLMTMMPLKWCCRTNHFENKWIWPDAAGAIVRHRPTALLYSGISIMYHSTTYIYIGKLRHALSMSPSRICMD